MYKKDHTRERKTGIFTSTVICMNGKSWMSELEEKELMY
jgi:hypothetical protein